MAAPLRDRLSFLSRLPVLLRGTADDDTPCPGYLFEEIASILSGAWGWFYGGGGSPGQVGGPWALEGVPGLPQAVVGTGGLWGWVGAATVPRALAGIPWRGRIPGIPGGCWCPLIPAGGRRIPNIPPEISHESPGSSQCLLEHLLTRLQSSSCHVKLKVLKILLHTCSQGSPQFVLQLKRNAGFIREAAVFSGPPDPLHGNSLNQKVRAAAQDLASVLFSDVPLPQSLALPARPSAPAGMGSSPSPCGSLQGFGFSGDRSGPASTGEALLSSLQRAAEAVAQAVLPAPGGPRRPRGDLPEDTYEPVRAPSPAGSPAPPAPLPPAPRGSRVSHQPGLAGGGWEEADSGHSSRESSQGHERSRASDSGSKSGSDSHSGASRELSHGTDRVDADSPGDCRREVSLVSGLTRGARVFLTREETQHFLKECGLLNCEVVLELLDRALEDYRDSVRMRSLSALSALSCSDLLSPEQILTVTQEHLQQLSQGIPGPVANRATKMLRQFEALCRAQPSPKAPRLPPAPPAGSAGDLLMDIPALAGESILTPLSPAPAAPPAPGEELGAGAEPPGAAVPPCPCQQGRGIGLGGDTAAPGLSLFAGMELVARPGAVIRPESPSAQPQTLPQPQDTGTDTGTDTEGPRQPSAFAFLNM
ncbi:AP-4 complex accessory subunit tepsin isoform X2 [Neopelma chrysocephalum]|uniref:AP-4 complex accessory subunit tepsin isoform X2 n=1 Tax=Neopelma chrysocephalum TaxID=114329 RepID=UPI000FCD1323|nr:AP-4 complex accessory subunit tepsin isoform X2 [Neopelma chrysocephalum]